MKISPVLFNAPKFQNNTPLSKKAGFEQKYDYALLNNAQCTMFKPITFKSSEIARTSEPNLSTYIESMRRKTKNSTVMTYFINGISKIDTDSKRQNKPISILDVGCCDGQLIRSLREFLPKNTNFNGLDLSQGMLDIGNSIDEKEGNKTNYTIGNAFDLPFKNNKQDVIIASSIMHELYSYASEEYNEESYSKASILHFMQQAYECLKPGGVLLIKDPATPQIDEYEPIKIANANKFDGEMPSIKDDEDLKNADITKLCTYDKLRRFCMDFYPAKDKVYFDKNGDCIMPRWLVTEFVRHRKWLRTPENWAYEIKENYGTMRPDEMSEFAQKVGFRPVRIENISIPNEKNLYAIQEGEFELIDMDNNKLSLEDFPMFLEVVLRKPRENTV